MSQHTPAENSVRVTIVIPAFNAATTIAPCIASIQSQSIDALEIICVDDASMDDTAQCIEALAMQDSRIRLLRQSTNSGASAARNRAMHEAQGRFMLFMDADDELVAQSLRPLLELAESGDFDAVKGTMLVADNGQLRPHKLNQQVAQELTDLASCPQIQHLYQYTTYLFRTQLITGNELLFDISLKNFQDPEFLSRLLPVCARISVTTQALYVRNLRAGSIITTRWRHENFVSLVSGANKALENLAAAGLSCTGPTEATCITWWHKLEGITAELGEDKCLALYRQIEPLISATQFTLREHGTTKAGAVLAMRQIQRGRYQACYRQMRRSHALGQKLPRFARKLYDLLSLQLLLLTRRV